MGAVVDLTTLITAVGLLFGVIVGDAAIFGNALYVSIAIPSKLQSSGLSQSTAEQVFIAEVNRYLEQPSILPTPSVSTSSASSLPMALAKPLQLQDVVYSVQSMIHDYGVVRVDGSVVADAQGSGLNMYVVLSNPPDPPVSISLAQPDGNAKALIEKAARETMLSIGPFRVAITDFKDGTAGDPAGFDRCKQTIAAGLSEGWDPRPLGATEDVLLFNLKGVLAIRDKNLVEAAQDFTQAKTIPGAYAGAYGVVSLNQAFLAIAQNKPKEAALRYNEGTATVGALHREGIVARLTTMAGLVAWSEGQNAVAERDFRAAIANSDTDPMPHLYLAQLLAAHGDTTGAATERQAAGNVERYDPGYRSFAFSNSQFDLVHGGYKPMF
jgi:hypothetical protein